MSDKDKKHLDTDAIKDSLNKGVEKVSQVTKEAFVALTSEKNKENLKNIGSSAKESTLKAWHKTEDLAKNIVAKYKESKDKHEFTAEALEMILIRLEALEERVAKLESTNKAS